MPISEQSRPRLAARARLRFDRREGRFLLLYPERGLLLNQTASDILQLCTGRRTVAMMVEALALRHGERDRREISSDVLAFLSQLQARGLVEV
jgi:coenzyme PQQ biosynthesis protein PqqD